MSLVSSEQLFQTETVKRQINFKSACSHCFFKFFARNVKKELETGIFNIIVVFGQDPFTSDEITERDFNLLPERIDFCFS